MPETTCWQDEVALQRAEKAKADPDPVFDASMFEAVLAFESGRDRLLRAIRARAKDNDKLRAALEEIANYDGPVDVIRLQKIARAAL